MVWNFLPLTGPKPTGAAACSAILQSLRDGFGVTRIVERRRLRPDSAWPGWLTPVGVLWEAWRELTWPLTLSWLTWTWLLWAAFHRRYT
jgi:hypothetical protein